MSECTGSYLAAAIKKFLKEIGIRTEYFYGQGYDGASSMKGRLKGVQAYIRKEFPLAIYVHCASHSLNLAVSTASSIPAFRNTVGIIEKIYVFFNTPKRQAILNTTIERICATTKKKKLIKFSPTRWVERYDAVEVYKELEKAIIDSLENIAEQLDAKVAGEATTLLNTIKNVQFQMTVEVLLATSHVLKPLSKLLQAEQMNLNEAMELADQAINRLQKMRDDSSFDKIFAEVCK